MVIFLGHIIITLVSYGPGNRKNLKNLKNTPDKGSSPKHASKRI